MDRNEDGLTKLPDGIHREVADATNPDVPGPLVDRIAGEFGSPDILVNTIGAFELGDALSVTAKSLHQLMDVNLGAALWLTQAVVPYMRDNGRVRWSTSRLVRASSRPPVMRRMG